MKKLLLAAIFGSTLTAIVAFDILTDSGKAGYCGSPSETYCTSCHSGSALNSGGGSVVIAGAPSVYTLGQTYPITVTVTQTGRSLFGFAMEALTTPGNANAGTLTVTNSAETHVLTATNGRKSMTHMLNGGATTGSHTFSFDWRAPLTNVGSVKFWAVGNACNGNGMSSGDLVYSTNVVITAPVGISESEKNVFELKVFPNPVHDHIFVDHTCEKKDDVSITLLSLDGKTSAELLHASRDKGAQHESLSIPAGLAPGVYFLRVTSGGHSDVKKIIIE